MQIEISKIDVQESKRRRADQGTVDEIAKSIQTAGLLNPITVCGRGEGYRLVAGLHRLSAANKLGWDMIEANVVDFEDELVEELAMIDENLCRSDLSALEKAKAFEERKRIYEQLFPEATEAAKKSSKESNTELTAAESAAVTKGLTPTFVADTAAKTGMSERVVRKLVQIGRDIQSPAAEIIQGTALEDRKTDLLEIAKEQDPEIQKKIAEKIISGEAKNAKQAKDIIFDSGEDIDYQEREEDSKIIPAPVEYLEEPEVDEYEEDDGEDEDGAYVPTTPLHEKTEEEECMKHLRDLMASISKFAVELSWFETNWEKVSRSLPEEQKALLNAQIQLHMTRLEEKFGN